MSGFLLDTNVVSELTKATPDSRVVAFLAAQDDLWLPTIVLHELEFGLNLLPLGRRRNRIHAALSALLMEYGDRVLPLDRPESEQAAALRARARRAGRVLHLADALIAGTAKVHDLAVATRNVADFEGLGVTVTNPWEAM